MNYLLCKPKILWGKLRAGEDEIHLFIFLFIYLLIYLFVYLFIYLFICLLRGEENVNPDLKCLSTDQLKL